MVVQMKLSRGTLTVAAIVLLSGVNIAVLLAPQLFEPIPYKNVRITSAEINDDQFNLVADMQTTNCRFVQLSVVGFNLGGKHTLEWEDVDGLGQNHIRLKGIHTMRITAFLRGLTLDAIEVRTRHRCNFELDEEGEPVGGELVDRLFTRFEP